MLRIAVEADPKSLDPQIVSGLVESNILQSLFEGLVNLDPVTLEPIPGVAERWDISPDRRTYTFYLDKNARWSDGVAITSADFVNSWERILNPLFAAEYAFLLYPIKNAKGYNLGSLKDFSQVGIRIKDTHTLEVELDNPTPYFLTLQVNFAYYPVPKHVIEKHGNLYEQNSRWTRTGNLVSNGAYKLNEWKLGQYVSVKRNTHFRDNAHTSLETIRFYPIKNQETEERAFRAGQIHITANVPFTSIAERISKKDPTLKIDPDLGVYYFMLNVAKPPLNDPRVRQALSLALNRKQIADAIRQRGELPAGSLISADVANYANLSAPLINEDINTARKLLAEAGYPEGKGFPAVELLYNTSDQHKQIAVSVQAMWKRHLNIDTLLLNQTWKVYLESRNQKNYQIARAGWFADYNDPMTFLEIWKSDSGMNQSHWKSIPFDQLLDKAAKEPDVAIRAQLLRSAETILINETPLIPVFFYRRAYLISPNVTGWSSNVMNVRPYQRIQLINTQPDTHPKSGK